MGFTVGINCVVVPIYINEMTPRELNGKMGAYFQVFINIGIELTNLIGPLFFKKYIYIYIINIALRRPKINEV